jgi:hypothetical protein
MDHLEIARRIAENRLFEDVARAADSDPAILQPFLQACHSTARVGGNSRRRAALCDDTKYRTFDTCRISGGGDDDLFLLCHRRFGLIAFSRSDVTGMRVGQAEFCTPTAEAEYFAQSGDLTGLPLGYLLEPVTPTALADLSASEQGDAAYWQPDRFAGVIFNHWD